MTSEIYSEKTEGLHMCGEVGNRGEDGYEREVLTKESISKIEKFALDHSDGTEEADELGKKLKELLAEIVSYCCSGELGHFLPVFSGAVDVYVVRAIEERLSVTVKMTDGETKKFFKRGILREEVEDGFLRLLDCCAWLVAKDPNDEGVK